VLDGRIVGSSMTARWTLTMATIAAVVGCTTVPPEAAPAFAPAKMSAISIGQSKAAVISAVGHLLSSYTAPELPNVELLTYAKPGATSIAGEYRSSIRGYDSWVRVADGRVESAWLFNADTALACWCRKDQCVPEWAAPCAVVRP
jgi:hypothetical protein